VVRLPNLISFLLYAFAIFRVSRTVMTTSSVYFIPASVLFLLNLYLLDFFGLSRGYGLSCALCTLSVSYLITAFRDLKRGDAWIAFFAAMLASYANFTALVFWVAVSMMVWVCFFIRFRRLGKNLVRPTVLLVLFIAGYALLTANPIIKMKGSDMFRDWITTGFFENTAVQMVRDMLYGSPHFNPQDYMLITVFLVTVVFGSVLYGLYKFVRSGFNLDKARESYFVASLVLFITAMVSITQCAILKTPYLTGRTALFFYPLSVIALVATAGFILSHKALIVNGLSSLVLSFLLLFQIADSMKLNSVKEWWFDAHTLEIVSYLDAVRGNRDVSLKTNWLFQPSFAYYKKVGRLPHIKLEDYDKNIDTTTNADFYYILSEDFEMLKKRFEPVLKLENRFWLVKRKQDVE
jgi:hypothetical protein